MTDPELGEVRECRVCREVWPLDDEFFYVNPVRGRRYYRTKCRACFAETDFVDEKRMRNEAHKCPRPACPVWVPAGRRVCYGHSRAARTPTNYGVFVIERTANA